MMSDIGTTKKISGSKTKHDQKFLLKIIFEAWFKYSEQQNQNPWSEENWNSFFEMIGVTYSPASKDPVGITNEKTFQSARLKFCF